MKKVVVTGANGFVGSAVCRELSVRGIEVIAVVRDGGSDMASIGALSGIRIACCPMDQYSKLPDIIGDRDIDVFYHFAWEGSSGPKRGDDAVQQNNIRYTCDLVRACGAMECKRFVFASSIMIYEIMTQIEKSLVPGINTLYCSAKLAADYMAATIAASLGIDYLRGVISNIYGPREKSARLINSSLRKLLRGEHCAFSPGEQLYDFIYCDDAAVAFAEIGDIGLPQRPYYIGSMEPRPLKEFLMIMRDQVDPQIGIGLGELTHNGFSLTYEEFDIRALNRDTGFVPKVPFDEGIRRTIRWLKEQEI
nr:NAD(P)-dependent oxidoreductase [uncultured Dysosmobacter sp.]